MRRLDLALLCDLLRLESDPGQMGGHRHGRRTARSNGTRCSATSRRRAHSPTLIARELSESGRWDFSRRSRQGVGAAGRRAARPARRSASAQGRRCRASRRLPGCATAIGPALVRPLAEALAVEENTRCIRRLRELLLGFGAAGRQSVEQLKSSSNPAVRRTAIDLLRVFGGSEALPELASMLGDSDPQVQRESIRAIVQIATPARPTRSCRRRSSPAESLTRHDAAGADRTCETTAIPLLCHALQNTRPGGSSSSCTRHHRGARRAERSSRNRSQALQARALPRPLVGAPQHGGTAQSGGGGAAPARSPETMAILQDAVERGSRGVRTAAQRRRRRRRSDASQERA